MMGEGRFHTKSEALSRWNTLRDKSETQLGSMLEVEKLYKVPYTTSKWRSATGVATRHRASCLNSRICVTAEMPAWVMDGDRPQQTNDAFQGYLCINNH